MSDQLTLPLPPTVPPATQAAVEASILGEGWTYDVQFRHRSWSTLVALMTGEERVFLEYRTYVDRARVVLYLSREIAPSVEAQVETLTFLNWINGTLNCSSFELHAWGERTEVFLRCALAEDLGHRIDAETVTWLTNLAFDPDGRYSPLIREVAEGRCTAQEAIAKLAPART